MDTQRLHTYVVRVNSGELCNNDIHTLMKLQSRQMMAIFYHVKYPHILE